jgi:hypothetical protein
MCGGEIRWVLSERGKRMPLDLQPADDTVSELFVLRGRDQLVPTAVAVPAGAFDEPLYRFHVCAHNQQRRSR